MSTAAPSTGRVGLQAFGLLLAACLVAAAVGLIARQGDLRSSSAESAEAPGSASPSVAAPDQPSWRISAWAAGTLGRSSKAALRLVDRRRPEVAAVIERAYDALFLDPGSLDRVLRATFSPTAARALRKSRAGLPTDPSDVRIVKRNAAIGIESSKGNQAAARVTLVAKLRSGSKSVRLSHRATLWMERTGRSWKVVAFDLRQKRLD